MIPRPVSLLEKAWNALYSGKRFLKLYYPNRYSTPIQTTLAVQITGQEALCEGFSYTLQLITYHGAVKLQEWVGKTIAVGFEHDHGGERFISGFIRSVKQLTPDATNVLYELEIVDFITLIKARKTWRIFQGLSVWDITKKILGEHRTINPNIRNGFNWANGDAFHLSYPARDFVLQAGESDHDFLTRLWKQEGIVWYFTHDLIEHGEHTQPIHTIHFVNSNRAFQESVAPIIRYHPDASVQGHDTITHLQAWRTLGTKYVTRSHSEYKTFDTRKQKDQNPIQQGEEASHLAEFNFVDHHHDPAYFSETWKHLKDHTENLAMHHRYKSKGFQGQSRVRAMTVGTTFELEWHDSFHPSKHRQQEERELLLVRVSMYAHNNLNLAAYQLGSLYPNWRAQGDLHTTPDEAPVYINRFDCVRRTITVVPEYDPSTVPNIGPVTATVVTRNNDMQDVDNMGRILVKFHFTHAEEHQAYNHNPVFDQPNLQDTEGREWTARVRVVQPWAHGSYGTAFYPRKDNEVLVQFINNHPDNPIVTGSVYNGVNTNASFHAQSQVEHDLISGIRSKENKDRRHNHLFFDDTHQQISTQLHSDHAHTQLTQGYLTSPRSATQATPRGEGFELRTDESGAIRTAKGLLITAFERLKSSGKQLSIEETQALMAESLEIFTQLGQYASQHMGLPTDTSAHQALQSKLKNWEQGSNTAPNASGGGAPIITVTAPAGMLHNTPETLAQQAGKNIDSIAHQHQQITSGKNTVINAGHGIGLFAQAQDLKTIAHKGKWIAQAQHNDAELQAGKNIKITAGGTITLIAGDGTFATLGGGQFLVGTSGPATIHAASHLLPKPKTMSEAGFEESEFDPTSTTRKYIFSK